MALTANNRDLCWPLVGVVDVCGAATPTPHGSVQTVMPVPMTSSPRSPLIHPGWFLLVDSRIDVLSETISKWVLAKMGGRTRSDTSDPLMETGNRVVWRVGLCQPGFSPFLPKNLALELDLGLVQGQPVVSCLSLGKLMSFSELWFHSF